MKTPSTFFCLTFAFCISISTTAKAQVDVNDSLALVDLYNSTNGPSWTDHDNWLTDPVSSWYGIGLSDDSKRVTLLKLPTNNLIGSIPPSFSSLIELDTLDLSYNQLTGNIPPEFGNLSNLKWADLRSNQLSGSIPPELSNLSNLFLLLLSNNQLSGNIPPELGNFSTFLYLYLDNNKLSGSIPPELGHLSAYLRLDHNQLSGNIPPELSGFIGGDLDLSYNQLSGNIPPELGNLSCNFLFLGHNQLSGIIPSELGNMHNLFILDLSNNQLSGSIPSELGNLFDLGELFLDSNQLSGNIPPELGNIYTFGQFLNLSDNQLSGGIPPELGKIIHLLDLRLSNNKLTGAIPAELGNLKELQYLFLDHNKLSKTIPSFFVDLTQLDSLDLSHNQFTFDGMESIAQKFSFAKYGKQSPIPVHFNDNSLSVSAGGTLSNNVYKWHKAGEPDKITTVESDSVFHPTESGFYYVRVSNKIATKLNLNSYPVWYSAPVAFNASNSLAAISNNKFLVYPNPANNILLIQTNTTASFSLLDQSGEILLTTNINKARSINISQFSAGEYYLKNNTTNAVQKIFIVR